MSKIRQSQLIKEIQTLEFDIMRKLRRLRCDVTMLSDLTEGKLQTYKQHLMSVKGNIEGELGSK